jgi:ferredoxin-NADP reductase
MKPYDVKIKEIIKYKDESFLLKLQKPESFEFDPGQFVMLQVGNEKRAYSIASAPSQSTLDILIKLHENGKVSEPLYTKNEGDEIHIIGPYGKFTLDKAKNEELFFITAGTGVAPFRSMIIEALEKNPERKITILFGFRNDYFFEDEWKGLESKYKNFKLICCCSNPVETWAGLKGRVTEHIKETIPSPGKVDIFICGPKAMGEEAEKQLDELSFEKDNIHLERW